MSLDSVETNVNPLLERFRKAQQNHAAVAPLYEEYSQRYENEYQVPHLSMRVDADISDFAATVNWCRLVVESIANRMSISGFISSLDKEREVDPETGEFIGESIDELLWDWWQAANMDKESRIAHTEALLQGVAYVIVNYDADMDRPEFILATSRNMYVTYDSRTGAVKEAFQWYDKEDLLLGDDEEEFGVIYTKDVTYQIKRDTSGGEWVIWDREEHNLGVVPVAPLVNRAKIGDRYGRSEIADVVPLSDFATRLMTNAQVAQEFLAMPLRYAKNVSQEDFEGPDGTPIAAWKAYVSSFLASDSEGFELDQLPGADLRHFVELFNMLAKQVSAVSGLPPHALGLTTSNPASADAIRSGESNLVQRIQDRSSSFEQGWELAMAIALWWVRGDERALKMRIETTWANPETPTFSAKADAVVKLRSAKIIPNEQAQEDLGYSPEKIRKNQQLLLAEQEREYGFRWEQEGLTEDGDERSTEEVPESPDVDRENP